MNVRRLMKIGCLMGLTIIGAAILVQRTHAQSDVYRQGGWTIAKVSNVLIEESYPVQYIVSYQRTCDDIETKPIHIKSDKDVILGVLVLRMKNTRVCRNLSEPGRLHIDGDTGENGTLPLRVVKVPEEVFQN